MDTPLATAPSLQIERVFEATRSRIFKAWTDPEAMKEWFGPASCRVIEADLDLRVGGEYNVKINNEEMGEIGLTGRFIEVDAPKKLVYTWQWTTPPMDAMGETRVTVEFTDLGRQTRIDIVHDGLPGDEARENHQEGWTGTLDKLEQYIS